MCFRLLTFLRIIFNNPRGMFFQPTRHMQRKVLIIDDEVDLCLLIRAHLHKLGYTARIAHTLGDGLRQLHADTPDILLLDNNLPDGTGWSRVVEINQQFPGMNIILISAVSSGHEFYQTLNFPFRMMEKPIQLSELNKYL